MKKEIVNTYPKKEEICVIFDTHTHLNAEEFANNEAETIKHAQELGVSEMAVVGFDYPTIEKTQQLSQEYDNIYSIVGWHPTEAGSYTSEVEKYLQNELSKEKVVALGETGLDFHWMDDPKETQEKIFRRQIAIAREMNLPFSVHNRDAMEDTYRILKDEKIHDIGGIMHSFNGDYEWAQRFLDLGMHLSYSGVVTFKKTTDVQEAAQKMPFDRMLVETDAPYLAPVPYRGKQNEPGYTRYVVEKIAELKGLSVEEVARQTTANAHRLFGIEQ